MKKNIIYISIFVLCFLNIKCVPDLDLDIELSPIPIDYNGETVTINVKEYKTNLPVSGVKFSTYYCATYDQYVGCTNKILLSSCITNTGGFCSCIFPKMSFEDIIIEKSMYWTKHYHQIESSKLYIIQPEAWVNVNFKTNVTYPNASSFFITINGELLSTQEYVQESNNSNKTIRIFGNEVNNVSWSLLSNSQVLNSGSFTLYPNKFENLEYTLNY